MKSRLTAFFLLAFALSWYPWLIALARGTTSGPNPLGPLVAAVIVTAVTERWRGLRAFGARLVRVRAGVGVWAAAVGMPLLLLAVAALLNIALGASTGALPSWRELPDRFLFTFLFVALGEEPGWRGYAVPQMQKSWSPLESSLILGAIWTVWHLPLMGNEFPLPILAPFVISVFGATLFLTWLFNRSDSVLLPMITHATVNTVGAGFVFKIFAGAAVTRMWWIYSLLWLAAGAALLTLDRRAAQSSRMSENERARTPSPDAPGAAPASPQRSPA